MPKKKPPSLLVSDGKNPKRKTHSVRPDADRRVRQNARIARVLKVLNLLQGRGRWNSREIAREIGCSERTVYRDLNVLEFAGVPWYFDEDQQCYRLTHAEYRFPALALTDDEVVGQVVATTLARAPGLEIGAGATTTTQKLAAGSAERVQQLMADAAEVVSVLDLKLADHSRHQEIIRTVQLALLRRKQLTGHYESPYEPKRVKLRLHPFRLCLIKSAWYLIARAPDVVQPRTYRIARFETLRMLDDPAIVPQAFNLRDYFGNAWAVFRGGQSYDVAIWFTPESARLVTETLWHHSQAIQHHADGSLTFNFRVDGLEEIANWVLSWTGSAKVLQPKELRTIVRKRLQASLEMNAD